MNDKSAILDLCDMSVENTKHLNRLFDLYRTDYTEFVDNLSDIFGKDWQWWMTNFASRNIFLSKAYRHICIVLVAIENMKNSSSIRKIVTTEVDIAVTLRQYIAQNHYDIDVEIRDLCGVSKCNVCLEYWNYFKIVMRLLRKRRIIRKRSKSALGMPDNEIIVIDTDVFSSCFDSGEYKARDFENILDYTDEDIYFLPYLYLNTDMTLSELIEKMVKTKKYRFIFRENYLKFVDYIKLFLFPFWCNKFCKNTKLFKQIDVTDIINKDIISSIQSMNSMEGILNYYLMNRMKKKNIHIKSLIGWYEGQPSSLGLFKAFHENYKESTSIGYEGYPADRRLMQCAPSPMQRKYQVAPRTIGIIGQIFETTIKQFDEKVDTIIVPPFRMKEVFLYMSAAKQEARNVMLVALPYNENDAAKIINELNTYEKIINQRQIHILFKSHPTKKQWRLKEYGIDKVNLSWEFVDGSFDSVLQKADILLTCASSTVYEAVVMGKKVILMGLPSDIVLSCIPLEMENKVKYAVVYDENDFENAIDILVDGSCEPLSLEGNRYLEKIDCKTTRCLLNRREK